MQRVTLRKCSQNLRYRQWILHLWCFLLLLKSAANALDALERRTNPEMPKEIQDSHRLSTSGRNKETHDSEARHSSSYSHSRVLHQQEGGSTSGGCTLDDTFVRTFYDRASKIWTVTTSMLSEINNDLQRIVDCAIQDDMIWFKTNETIQPSTTIDISLPLTLRGEAGTTLTCPEQGELLVTSSSFTMENIVVSGCNGSSSIIILHPNCNTGRMQATIVFNNVSFESNTVIGDRHIIKANTSCSEVEITGLVLQENKCVGTHCVSLGRRNTLTNVHLRSNKGSSNTSQDSSIFFANEGSESFVVNMTSTLNDIRTIQASNGSMIITNSHFENNNVTFAAVFLLNATPLAYIDQCTFVRNSGYNGSGGAIQAIASNVKISSSAFLENNARSCGSIFFVSRCNCSIVKSTFDNNTARESGGAICVHSNASLVLTNSSFKGNDGWYGGALSVYSASNISIDEGDFIKNVASNGGCVTLSSSCIATISNSRFFENEAGFHGGAISLRSASELSIYDSTFVGNDVRYYGGAIGLQNSRASLMNVQLKFNRAVRGGSLHAHGSSIEMTNSVVIGSRARISGGAIYMEATNAAMETIRLESNEVRGYGGAVGAFDASHINASNLHIASSNARRAGAGIALHSASSLLCFSCMISNNTASIGAGFYADSDNSIPVVAQLQNSRFENNSAKFYGGGIEFDAHREKEINCSNPNVTCSHIILLNTSFVDNYATHSGAIMSTTDRSKVLVKCEYQQGRNLDFVNETYFTSMENMDLRHMCSSWKRNRALSMERRDLFGINAQEVVLSISPSDDEVRLVRSRDNEYVLENVRGGQQLPYLVITFFDDFGRGPAPTSPRSFDARLFSPNGFSRGAHVVTISNGSGSFSNIVGYVIPGRYTFTIRFSNQTFSDLRVVAIVRKCQVGEEPTSDNRTCQKCDAFSYNFNASEVGGCKACPDDATCQNRYVVPKEGFWHNGPCHHQVKRCLVEEACKYESRQTNLTKFTKDLTDCNMNKTTMEVYRTQQCNEGHEGPLCGSCDASFGLSFRFQCLRCPNKGISFLMILGVTLYLLVVSAFTIKGCLPPGKRKPQNKSIRVRSSESSGVPNDDPEVNIEMVKMIVEGLPPLDYFQKKQEETSPSHTLIASNEEESQSDLTKWKTTEVFKIMINFLQTTSIAASLDLDWTYGIDGLFEASELVGAISTSAISGSIDCLASSTSKVMRAMCKILLNLTVPAIVILLFAALWGFVTLKNGEDVSYFGKRTVLSIIAVTYISYLGLTKVAVRAFYCVDVYDSANHFESSKTQHLAIDTSIECYKGGHFALIAIAVIVLGVITVAFPLVSAAILSRNKHRRVKKDSWTFETAGFLFRTFKENCLFWESIVMLRKACLSVIVVFSYLLEGRSQGILASVVLLTCLYAHLTIKPYRKDFKILNHFESASLFVSCLTFTLGLFFAKDSSSESVRAFLSVLIIAINILFFMFLLFAFFMCGIGHLRVVLQSNNLLLPGQVPWWRVLEIFIITRFRNWFKFPK